MNIGATRCDGTEHVRQKIEVLAKSCALCEFQGEFWCPARRMCGVCCDLENRGMARVAGRGARVGDKWEG